MAKYRKKGSIVEAEQWFPGKEVKGVNLGHHEGCTPFLETDHGRLFVGHGDWIVTDEKGRRNRLTDEQFQAIYESAE